MGCSLRALLVILIVAFVLWGVGYVLAFHGNDIAAWAMALGAMGPSFWLRKTSATIRNLPPYNSMRQTADFAAPQGAQPAEPFNLWSWLTTDSPEFFDQARGVMSNMDMWVTILILLVVALIILAIVNLFRGKLSLTTFKNPLKAAFKDAPTALESVGFISLFMLGGLILSEGLAGRGWAYVSQAFTQFWWIGMVGIVIGLVLKAIGPELGRYALIALAAIVVVVFVISMANPDLNVDDVTVKVPLQGVSDFASNMYRGWMDITKVYFWFLVMGIGSFIMSNLIKTRPVVGGPRR